MNTTAQLTRYTSLSSVVRDIEELLVQRNIACNVEDLAKVTATLAQLYQVERQFLAVAKDRRLPS
jgi:hypothetical protein